MNLRWMLPLLCACALRTAFAAEPALLRFDSACDFSEIALNIKQDVPRESGTREASVFLNVTLTHDAQMRMEEISKKNLKRKMTLVIDEKQLQTTTVESVINSPHIQIALSRQQASDLIPTLGLTKGAAMCAAH